MTGITNTYKDIGNLLRVQLPSYLPYPFGGSALDVNIPIFQNLPKISWDIDGTLTIAYGVDPGFPRDYTPPDPTFGPQPSDEPEPTPVPKHWYDDRTWRSKTQNEIDREAKLREKKTAFSKYKAKCGAMWDGLKPHVVNFLGNMSFSSGAFAMITGQFHEHKGDGDEPFYYNC